MNVVETILQRADMEMPRSPRELCEWVESKASELSQTSEGKAYSRSGAILPKKLWEEMRPFGLFAYYQYGAEGVKCIPNLSNDNYDGKIEFLDSSIVPIYVELTYAKDGYDEHLRLKVMSSEGSVNALGKMAVSGTKASGHRIKIENEMVGHIEVRNAAIALVKDRLAGKANKQYGQSHVLVIVVDDYLPLRTGDDKEILEQQIKNTISGLTLDFGAVYLLGASGKYCTRIPVNN